MKSNLLALLTVTVMIFSAAQSAASSELTQSDLDFAFSNMNENKVLAPNSVITIDKADFMNEAQMASTEGQWWFIVGIALRFTTSQALHHYATSAGLAYGTYRWARDYNTP